MKIELKSIGVIHTPYKENATYGWTEDLDNKNRLILQIKGVPHDY